MRRIGGLWVLPYGAAALLWLVFYRQFNVQQIIIAGQKHPFLFILIVGAALNLLWILLLELLRR